MMDNEPMTKPVMRAVLAVTSPANTGLDGSPSPVGAGVIPSSRRLRSGGGGGRPGARTDPRAPPSDTDHPAVAAAATGPGGSLRQA